MKNVLTKEGVSYLWGKIKDKFATKTALSDVEKKIPTVTNDLTNTLKSNYDKAYTHSQAAHAPSNAQQNVQSDWNATSGDAFIKNKPTIPSAVTESTVSNWGFTKNTGTYSKPSAGIPETDLSTDVKTKLNKDATVKELNKGYKQEFWVGTKAEYEALTTTSSTCLYIITDDSAGNDYVTATDVKNAINEYKAYVDDSFSRQSQIITNHISDTNNPHSVTASQIGAATSTALTSHINNKSNPHGVTAAQIGASTNKIYASTKAPTSSDGNNGDLWVVYE